jgi:hypothetical protein
VTLILNKILNKFLLPCSRVTEDEDQKEDDGRERRQEDLISTRRPNWLYCVLGSYRKVYEVSVVRFRRAEHGAETSCESSILEHGRRGSEVGRLGCEPWLRARRAGMKTRILSAHISFSINMTGIIRRAYAVWDNQTIVAILQSAAVFSILRPRAKTVKTCPMQSKRQLQLTARRQLATRRVHGRPRHYTRMDSQTHIDHARTVMRGYGARRDIIDVHMRETRKTCGHLLHPQIRTARESSEKVPREFPHGGVHI